MTGSITTAIRGAIPDSDNAKLYLAHIEEQFQGSFKAHATTLITKMVTLKYSGSNGIREHILRMNDMASQLKEERLKSEQPDSAHVDITGPSKGKGKKFGKGNVQGNKSASVSKTDKASSSGTKGSSGPRDSFPVKKLNKWDCNVLVGNGEKAQVEAIETLRLVLESDFNLDLVDTVYVPSTPQQNGLAERRNHTLIDMVRKCLLGIYKAMKVCPTHPIATARRRRKLNRVMPNPKERRRVMALVAHYDLELHQMDVKTAFINGDLHENVSMTQPEGFMVEGCVDTLKSTSGYVFMLAKGVVLWKSAKQSLVASHTMEAEFVACFEVRVMVYG
ncbi:hypothetical protein RJ639_006831 [Escallonia herrerae]|uniref:Reverse transcriptase Ty1/copia-type domain-containing protein n=1 Tax=Escallonia herrerae TaxID=1293975 RepID=A0AA88VXK4_9ASTE|nr:hypothetical protein RJ639_006831 [Escallonia herrerae]